MAWSYHRSFRSCLRGNLKNRCPGLQIKISDSHFIGPVLLHCWSRLCPLPLSCRQSSTYIYIFFLLLRGFTRLSHFYSCASQKATFPMTDSSRFWPQLSLKSHINHIDKTSYYHLRSIIRLRRLLSQKDRESLIHAFATTSQEYHTLLLASLPEYSLLLTWICGGSTARVFNRK